MKKAILWTAAVLVSAGIASAADDPMVGDWKLNPAKSKLTDEMKVASLGGNKYSIDFGGGAMEVVADGTDQPGTFGLTMAIKVDGPGKWTVLRKKDGKVVVTGIWTLSPDGKKLNDHYTSVQPNGGTNSLDYVYERRNSGEGFVGDWVSTSEQVNTESVMQVRPWEGDGLSFATKGGGGTTNVKFDEKDYAAVGAVVDGVTSSASRANDREFEMTVKIDGKVINTQEMKLSEDGKTLTNTIHIPGRSDADVMVFERQ